MASAKAATPPCTTREAAGMSGLSLGKIQSLCRSGVLGQPVDASAKRPSYTIARDDLADYVASEIQGQLSPDFFGQVVKKLSKAAKNI